MERLSKLIPRQLSGDLRQGGWVLQGNLAGDTDAVSSGQNWQLRGRSGAGFYDTNWRVFFDGHITGTPNDIRISRYFSEANVIAGTGQALLAGEALQAIGFTEQASPANDHQITGFSLADAVQHILERHCNIVFNGVTMPDGIITDTSIDTTNSTPLTRYNVDESDNLWQAIQSIGGGEKSGEFYAAWFDRRNKFYYQPSPAFFATPQTSRGIITADNVTGPVSVTLNNAAVGDRIGQVILTATKDEQTDYDSTWPTSAGRGRILRATSGIWANSQARADTLAERLYKWLTRAHTLRVPVDAGLILFGDDGRGLDLADKIEFSYDGPAVDAITGAGVHIVFNRQAFFVYGASVSFDVGAKAARGTLLLEQDPT